MTEAEVLFEQRGTLGLITLNKPESLNALTYGMVTAIDAQLDLWEEDARIHHVAIRGAGEKAFAAGGDIRWLYDNGQGGATGDQNFAFFRDEYRLNTRIKRYPKPFIGLMDGIVMGGGVGVSIHGCWRVATERTMFAMPETGIGLFPDVGATYFLSRLPHQIGMWLGLTGARLKGVETRAARLCDWVIRSSQLEDYINALGGYRLSGRDADDMRNRVREQWMGGADQPGGYLYEVLTPANAYVDDDVQVLTPSLSAEIEHFFGGSSVEDILDRLAAAQTEWAMKQRQAILSKSPTSTRIAFRQIREGANLSFEDCMRLEYRLARYCMTHPDFYEGVRAVIIDKDNQPNWSPASLAEASEAFVAPAFADLGDEELILP